MRQLRAKYRQRKKEIVSRLKEFDATGKKNGKALFSELAFCLLTPQSKARSCDIAVKELKGNGLLFSGNARQMAAVLAKRTRFHNNKARYIAGAREKFGAGRGFAMLRQMVFEGSETEARERLVLEVKGLGMKEASHFLRNVGRGKTIAILDRHILKNLRKYGATGNVPGSLTKKRYLEIEGKMEKFCRKAKIPMSHLDLLFWAEEAGEIFK